MSYRINHTKYLSEPEIDSLKRTIALARRRSPRDCLLIELALATGARATELLSLEACDLDPHEQSVLIHGIKRSDDRTIPLPPELFKRLMQEAEGKDGRIFSIGYRRLVDIWTDFRPSAKKFHSLRHTFAITLYRRTKDLRLVQVALGHRSINNTMVYSALVYETSELRKALL